MWKIRQWLSFVPPNCIPGKKISSKKFQLSATHAIRFSHGRGGGAGGGNERWWEQGWETGKETIPEKTAYKRP